MKIEFKNGRPEFVDPISGKSVPLLRGGDHGWIHMDGLSIKKDEIIHYPGPWFLRGSVARPRH